MLEQLELIIKATSSMDDESLKKPSVSQIQSSLSKHSEQIQKLQEPYNRKFYLKSYLVKIRQISVAALVLDQNHTY